MVSIFSNMLNTIARLTPHELGARSTESRILRIYEAKSADCVNPATGGSAFRLWHTFSSESNYFMAEGVSDNLMDYNDNGTRLHKYQWDLIHNPEGGLYVFQDEDEGAMTSRDDESAQALIDGIRSANQEEQESFIASEYIQENQYFYEGKIKVSDKSFDVLIEHWYYSGKHDIDPSEKYDYLHSNKKDVTIFEFSGPIANGSYKPLLKIHVDNDKKTDFEDYLFGPKTIFLDNEVSFISQSTKTGCWTTCKEMAATAGAITSGRSSSYFHGIDIAKSTIDGEYTTRVIAVSNDSKEKAVKIIDEYLFEDSKPVVVGVHYKKNLAKEKVYNNYNVATQHFLLIIGKGYNKTTKKYYYRFYDPGTSKGGDDNEKTRYSTLDLLDQKMIFFS